MLFHGVTKSLPKFNRKFGVVLASEQRNFLRILGEQKRKRGEREANAKREWRARGGALKNAPLPSRATRASRSPRVPRSPRFHLIVVGEQGLALQQLFPYKSS